jgi:hypothetical protein
MRLFILFEIQKPMKFRSDFKNILKPASIGGCLVILIFFIFIVGYALLEYQRYLSRHKKTQQEELKIIQQKTGIIIGNLTALHQLTKDRVAASHGDAERIQNILSSTPRLYAPQELPKIKRLSYYKYSFPQLIITRFGSLPLDASPLPRVRASERETEITFHQNIILSKTPVLDVEGNPEGILEVLITPLDFKASLGDLRTLSFYPTSSSQEEKNYLLQKEPFALYAKWPDHFWKFAFLHKERYAVFLFYIPIVNECWMQHFE